MSAFVTRFAPSPTGLLHLGHAYSALIASRAANAQGGRMILRIEDIDQTRCKPEFEAAIFEDLEWLGLTWDLPVRRQSDHLSDYENALETLRNRGLAYRCFKTRKEVADEIARAPHETPEGPQFFGGPLPRSEEQAFIEAGAAFAWRLSISEAKHALGEKFDTLSFQQQLPSGEIKTIAATPDIFGDAVIARKDAGTSYHLASVHDDALQGITHVLRGEDLASAAHFHRLLQVLLDYPEPVYQHHKLITDDAGNRLAKRDKSITLRALRAGGETPTDVFARLGLSGVKG
ncbi:tRNA glutamyl-Q(34) synthetase GluQRS [Hyphococcus lacteus]|uniref:tRNA glutamyl-Q(34) synthetase GluQRS n=1 Tax=Hyphococcus lacteus TaxID=3143536 RepID=A0ABV3Z6F3_9PROT